MNTPRPLEILLPATLVALASACASDTTNGGPPGPSGTVNETTSPVTSNQSASTSSSPTGPTSASNTSAAPVGPTVSSTSATSSSSAGPSPTTPGSDSTTSPLDTETGESATHADETSVVADATSGPSDATVADSTSSEPAGGETPSPGCDKGGRPNDGKLYVAGKYWVTFPSSYDGSKPFPLLFGFHGCGDGNRGDGTRTEYTDLTKNNVLGQDYVVAAPVSSDAGGCWNYNTDVVRAKELYDEIVNNHCVDTAHVFATGHSSGAQFIVQLLQGNHSADAAHFGFRGMAPVAASAYNHSTTMAVMYIQGQNDTVRGGSGKDVVDDFVAANQCGNASSPYAGVETCQSGGTVDPGCVQYEGCGVPTVWCSHNDPQYSNTSHGVPCFAAPAMDHFFKSL